MRAVTTLAERRGPLATEASPEEREAFADALADVTAEIRNNDDFPVPVFGHAFVCLYPGDRERVEQVAAKWGVKATEGQHGDLLAIRHFGPITYVVTTGIPTQPGDVA